MEQLDAGLAEGTGLEAVFRLEIGKINANFAEIQDALYDGSQVSLLTINAGLAENTSLEQRIRREVDKLNANFAQLASAINTDSTPTLTVIDGGVAENTVIEESLRRAVGQLNGNFQEASDSLGGEVSLTVQLPQVFQDLIGGNLIRVVNGELTRDFTPSDLVSFPGGHTVLYCDVDTGSDANPGTQLSKKKSIHACITAGNALSVPGVDVMIAGGVGKVYARTNSFDSGSGIVVPNKPFRFIADGGAVWVPASIDRTWALDSGTTYIASFNPAAVVRVLDLLNLTDKGYPTALTSVGSAGAAQSTPGSYYNNGTTSVRVNRIDGLAVTNKNTVLQLNSLPNARNASSGNTAFIGLTLLGGNDGALHLSGNATGDIYIEDCMVAYARGPTGSRDIDNIVALDVRKVVALRPKGYVADKDAFNFHIANSTVASVVICEAEAWDNGFFASNTSCNGPTGHDGCKMLVYKGNFGRNHGASLAFINPGTEAACIGTSATGDLGDVDRGGSQPAGVGYCSLTGAVMYMYGTVGDRQEAGGTFVELETA